MRFTPTNFSMTLSVRRISLVLVIAAVLGLVFYAYLHFSENGYFPSLKNDYDGFLLSAFAGMVVGASLHYTNQLINRWLSWKNYFATRLIVGYLSNAILAAGIAYFFGWMATTLPDPDMLWNGFTLADPDMALKAGILLACTLFIYTIIYALLYSYQHYAVTQIESLRSERKQMQFQFEALKSQISPHYLFNSLNTISSLVYKDSQSAEQFIRRLAQTYQYILATQNKPYVSLQEEVEFVQSYYYLLRIRFQQQLTVDINLPASVMKSRIPPLTLQMLVENAVKHNNLGNDKKLFIYITAQDNTYLKVINTKTANYFNVTSFKVGLDNIRKRYEFFTDKKIEIKDDDKFTVVLPVIAERKRATA